MASKALHSTNLFDLTGCIAVVTGGGTGLGFMMAKALEANGAKVYIIGRRLEVLQTAAKQAVISLHPYYADYSILTLWSCLIAIPQYSSSPVQHHLAHRAPVCR